MADATMPELNAALHQFIEQHDPAMRFRIAGVPYQLGKEEEWIEAKNLSLYSITSRKHDRFDRIYVEVICYSFDAQTRKDKNWNRVWEIAETYHTLLSQARITVNSSCIQLKEARSIFLDPRTLGDFGKNIDQTSPLLHAQCVAIGCEGLILKTKE